MKTASFKKGTYNGLVKRTALNKDRIYLDILCLRDNLSDGGFACYLDLTIENLQGLMDIFGCNWESIEGKYCRFKVNKKGKATKIGHIIANNWFAFPFKEDLNDKKEKLNWR